MKIMMTMAAMLLTTTAAQAQSIADNFDGEMSGSTVLNYAAFSQFDVTNGAVDLLFQPNSFGLTCAGGSGSCVDLDGSTGVGGTLTTKAALSFATGQLVTLSVDLSGNQRGAGTDNFFLGLTFGGNVLVNDYTLGGAFGSANLGSFGTISGIITGSSIADTAAFSTYSISFRAGTAGSVFGSVGTDSADNQGPILDNFRLSVAAVPEPATWGLMILGIGGVGGALRRRSTKVSFA